MGFLLPRSIPFLPEISHNIWRKFVHKVKVISRENRRPQVDRIDRWIYVIQMRKTGNSFREIGKALGVTRQYACSLYKEAVRAGQRWIEKHP